MKRIILVTALLCAASSFGAFNLENTATSRYVTITMDDILDTVVANSNSWSTAVSLEDSAAFNLMVDSTNGPGGFAVLDDQGEIDISVMTNSLDPYMLDMSTVARLDENGKIDESKIPSITIVYTGGTIE